MKFDMFAVRGSCVEWRKHQTSGCGSSRGLRLVLCLLSGAAYPVVQAEEWVHPMTESPVELRVAGAFDPVDELSHLERLPLDHAGSYVRYEGSIDKKGLNGDQNWYGYPKGSNEWIVFEHRGPGCIHNLTKHAYLGGEGECTYRFYFDGSDRPTLVLSTADFGSRYPSLEPFGGAFVTPDIDGPEGGFHIVRNFAPIPYARSCQITTDRDPSRAGWGHVVSQCYYDGRKVVTYDPKNGSYIALGRKLRQTGRNPIKMTKAVKLVQTGIVLRAGETREIFSEGMAGLVAGIEIQTHEYSGADLANLVIRAFWNGSGKPDLDVPFGALFANELGFNQIRTLLSGMGADGSYYDYHPMPYARGARIEIENRGPRAVRFDRISVTQTHEYDALYASTPYGVFRGLYLPLTETSELHDTVFAEVRGCGHVVGSTISARHVPGARDRWKIWEGDARIHLDGSRTPCVESDGSESYSSYGWGFWDPPQSNPWSSYDCIRCADWSMTRHLLGDAYAFNGSFRFGFEHGPENRYRLRHSGAVFWYGMDGLDWCELSVSRETVGGKEVSLTSVFEGELAFRDPVTLSGHAESAARLRFAVPDGTRRIVLRRVSDQRLPRQLARVTVNGREMAELPWFVQDCNPVHRWLEDDYPIDGRHLRLGSENVVSVEALSCDGVVAFNDFGYRAFAVVPKRRNGGDKAKDTEGRKTTCN